MYNFERKTCRLLIYFILFLITVLIIVLTRVIYFEDSLWASFRVFMEYDCIGFLILVFTHNLPISRPLTLHIIVFENTNV